MFFKINLIIIKLIIYEKLEISNTVISSLGACSKTSGRTLVWPHAQFSQVLSPKLLKHKSQCTFRHQKHPKASHHHLRRGGGEMYTHILRGGPSVRSVLGSRYIRAGPPPQVHFEHFEHVVLRKLRF